MKKIYKFLCAVAISVGALSMANAQVVTNNRIATPGNSKVKLLRPNNNHTIIQTHNSPRSTAGSTTQSVWMNGFWANETYLETYNGVSTLVASVGAYPIFPDSTMLFPFSNGHGGTAWENNGIDIVGNILDPLSANMQAYAALTYPGFSWNQFNDYTVDSMGVDFVYFRSTDPSVVDTMVVYLYNDSNPSDAPYSGFEKFLNKATYPQLLQYYPLKYEASYGIPFADTSQDTLEWKNQMFDPINNTPLVSNPTTMRTYKIPLTSTDTNSFLFHTSTFSTISNGYSTTFHVPGGKQACSAVGFIPGYTYSKNPPDTISHYNEFDVIYAQENGANTFPQYYGSGGIVTGQHDWNVSSTITTYEHYELAPSATSYEDSLFEVPWLFDSAYFLDEYSIYYKVTSTFNVGVNEIVSATGTTLYQNQPNPANHTTLIQYSTKSEGTATIEVTDLTGRVIMTMDQGNQSEGLHSATIDVSHLSQGIYLYTLRTNSEALTRRMVITE